MTRSLKKGPFVDHHLLAKGGKTRNPRKPSNKFIVKRRK